MIIRACAPGRIVSPPRRSRTRTFAGIWVTSLVLVAILAPNAEAVSSAASFNYPIMLSSPRLATFTGSVDCEEAPVDITLSFGLHQNTIIDPPAIARTHVSCEPGDAYPWTVVFTRGIFHPGVGRIRIKATSCDASECSSLTSVSNASIARSSSFPFA